MTNKEAMLKEGTLPAFMEQAAEANLSDELVESILAEEFDQAGYEAWVSEK